MSEMDEWVKFYESKGLTYFPIYGITNGVCRCEKGAECKDNTGKHPVYAWRNKPSRKPRATDNIGISTDNLIVVDLDGDVGEDALDAYPRTFTTGTGHGYHLWYWADPTKTVKSCVGWKPKIDIRAHGGLIIVPPSRHRKGTVYHHVRGDTIQPVPKWLLDELPEKGMNRRKIGHDVVVTAETTHPIMVPLGRIIVQEMADTTENRNATLFRLACRYFEQADTGLLGQDVLRDLFDAAVSTGLTVEEVTRTLESASKSV